MEAVIPLVSLSELQLTSTADCTNLLNLAACSCGQIERKMLLLKMASLSV